MSPPGVPLPYRLFMLYIDPLLALSGAYIAHFHPATFIAGAMPASVAAPFIVASHSRSSSLAPLAIPPIMQLLLTSLASLYLLFALNATFVLRLAPSLPVWRSVTVAYLASDVGHMWALYAADPGIFVRPAAWSANERINLAILAAGLLLRLAFLCGIGLSRTMLRRQGDKSFVGKTG